MLFVDLFVCVASSRRHTRGELVTGVQSFALPIEGKPIAEARGEILSAAGLFDYFAEQGKRIEGRVLQRPLGQRAMVTRHPVGPVAGFSPWNFPVNLMVKKIAPALAAGCVVIAKAPEEKIGRAHV